MCKVLLIIPAYNEEENILKTYNSIKLYNKKHKTNYDVIVINDGSRDNTESILVENKIPHVKLIHNLGIGGAVQTGYRYAYENGYDIAVHNIIFGNANKEMNDLMAGEDRFELAYDPYRVDGTALGNYSYYGRKGWYGYWFKIYRKNWYF